MPTNRGKDDPKWITNVSLPQSTDGCTFDVQIANGTISEVRSHKSGVAKDATHSSGDGCLLAPSLCHPHVHLDKAFILSHPRYRNLKIKDGTFQEAMDLTSKAKSSFTMDDLLVRGQRVIDESCAAGVTHMRAFVEVDEIVGLLCLQAGAELKRRARDKGLCHIQLCAFAQLPLKPKLESGDKIRSLMEQAMAPEYEVDAIGSTPYVEPDDENKRANIRWMVDCAVTHDKHLDFHLDYTLDPEIPAMIHHVISDLKSVSWSKQTKKVITLGHCTRLIYFSDKEWQDLVSDIGSLPISFVGLPTSDLYMMKSPQSVRSGKLEGSEIRGTLPIIRMIKEYGLNAAIGFNNIGNAFTPQGSCDPLYLANLAVAVFQAGTVEDARLLYECISSRARAAIGFSDSTDVDVVVTERKAAHLILFGPAPEGFESEQGIEDKVYYYHEGGRNLI